MAKFFYTNQEIILIVAEFQTPAAIHINKRFGADRIIALIHRGYLDMSCGILTATAQGIAWAQEKQQMLADLPPETLVLKCPSPAQILPVEKQADSGLKQLSLF